MRKEPRKLQIKALENAHHPFVPHEIYDAEVIREFQDYLDVQMTSGQGLLWFSIFRFRKNVHNCTLHPLWIQKYWERFGKLPSEQTVKALEK